MNPKTLSQAISSAQSVKLGLASNPESSSAWVKTLIDPAHAREYGCRGIPDENQQPTLVLNGRDTSTYYSNSLTGSGLTKFYYWDSDKWNEANINSVYNAHWTSVTFIMAGGINRPYYVVYQGGFSTSSADTIGYPGFAVNYRGAIVSPGKKLNRIVAQSATLSWVAQELNRGGYVEAGYWLPEIAGHSSNGSIYVDIRLDDFSNLATYTGTAEDGVYIVSPFNDYDIYRYWKAQQRCTTRIYIKGVGVTLDGFDEFINPQGFGGMRPYFVTYHAFDTNGGSGAFAANPWGLRLTTCQVVETQCPYREGGADAAVYDKASVEDMIALYDSMDLIFPARYNDWKKVWSWIKSHAPKAVSFAANVMRHFPASRNLGDALSLLVGDMPRNYPLMQGISHLAPTGTNGRSLMLGAGSTTDGEFLLTKKQKRALKTRAAINRSRT